MSDISNELSENELQLADADVDKGEDTILESTEIMRVAFGNAVATVKDDKSITVHARVKDAVSNIANDAGATLAKCFSVTLVNDPSTLATVYDKDGITLPAGVGVVVGPASVGKTPVLKWIVANTNEVNPGSAHLIRFGEPLPGYLTRESDAVLALTSCLLDPAVKVIAIDSIKDLLATMGGGLMARGVPRELFRMLSQWGTIAASLGKLIIVPLNISTDNADALAEVESAVLSNATFAAVAGANVGASDRFTFATTARLGEGKRRLAGKWELSFNDNGKPTIVVQGKAKTNASGNEVVSSISLTQFAVHRALAGALNKDNQ